MPTHSSPRRTADSSQPFSLEDFGLLVSTALDVQRVPDSALAFHFGAHNAPPTPTRRPRSRHGRETRPQPARSLSRFRGAFVKKQAPPNASPVERLASTSVPHLLSTAASASLANLTDIGSDSASDYPSPRLSPTMPCTPVSPPRRRKLDIPDSPEPLPKTNSKSFLNLKPITIPKLNKKRSKLFFFSGSPALPTPDASFSAPSTSLPANEGMHSFFDDSGYDNATLHITSRKKSRPNLRMFFSSASMNKSKIDLHTELENLQHRHVDKELPPTPKDTELFFSSHPYQVSDSDSDQMHSKLAFPSDNDRDLFYFPPHGDKSLLAPRNNFNQDCAASQDRTPRSSNPTPRTARRRLQSSPSPYPSPTSPLPPTPELSPVGLPVVSPPNSDHYHGEDKSIDSLEILAWRMPALQLQTSKISSDSSAADEHARGRPSRESIHERLGLGPRLHVLGSLPDRPDSPPRARKTPKAVWQTSPRRSATLPRVSSSSVTKPAILSSSRALKAGGGKRSTPIAALASASLVSLRSIATITASNHHGESLDKDEDEGEAEVADRAFTPEEDPFAVTTPVSIVSSVGGRVGTKRRAAVPSANRSAGGGALHMQNVPVSAPATLSTFDHCHIKPPVPFLSAPAPQRKSGLPSVQRGMQTSEDPSPLPSPSSAYSSLPSSLDSGSSRPRTSSTPSLYRGRARNVLAALAKATRKHAGGGADACSPVRRGSLSSEDGRRAVASVVGHSRSRPHSPFPLLFARSKALQMSNSESASPSKGHPKSPLRVHSALPPVEDTFSSRPESTTSPEPETRENSLLLACTPSPLSAHDTDVFGEVCDARGDSAAFEVKRDMVSPTAYLLEADEYECEYDYDYDYDAASSNEDGYSQAERSSVLEAGFDAHIGGGSSAVRDAAQPEDVEFGQQRSDAESEAETDLDNHRSASVSVSVSESWPLPPYRTVVVDVERGEGWHDVEPFVEYAPPCAFSDISAPRHAILAPPRVRSASPSTRSAHSAQSGRSRHSGSSGASGTSQRLGSRQARLIASLSQSALGFSGMSPPPGSSSSGPESYRAPSPHSTPKRDATPARRRVRARSSERESVGSSGRDHDHDHDHDHGPAPSLKTTRSAYYSVRSTLSAESAGSGSGSGASSSLSPSAGGSGGSGSGGCSES